MRFLKSAFWTILAAVLFLISIFLVELWFLSLDQQMSARIIHLTAKPLWPAEVFLLLGICVFLASCISYWMGGSRPDSSATYTFQGDRGPIDISLRALEDFLSRYFAEKPVVNSVRTRIGTTRDRKKLRIHASISVWSEQGLRDASENVQREIAHCLKEGLGLDNVESVVVSVDKIIASKKPARAILAGKSPAPAITETVKEDASEEEKNE